MIEAKNIRFEYADNTVHATNREQMMINNINRWLGEYYESINKQAGTIEVFFPNDMEQRISFDGMSDELQTILYRQLEKFQPPNTRHSDSPGM